MINESRSFFRGLGLVLVLIVTAAALAQANPSSAAGAGDDDGFKPITPGGNPPACPVALQEMVKQCVIAITLTQNGEYAVCYCDRNGNRPVLDLTLPPGERNLASTSSIVINKLTKPGDPNDPCVTMKIDGRKERICW